MRTSEEILNEALENQATSAMKFKIVNPNVKAGTVNAITQAKKEAIIDAANIAHNTGNSSLAEIILTLLNDLK